LGPFGELTPTVLDSYRGAGDAFEIDSQIGVVLYLPILIGASLMTSCLLLLVCVSGMSCVGYHNVLQARRSMKNILNHSIAIILGLIIVQQAAWALTNPSTFTISSPGFSYANGAAGYYATFTANVNYNFRIDVCMSPSNTISCGQKAADFFCSHVPTATTTAGVTTVTFANYGTAESYSVSSFMRICGND